MLLLSIIIALLILDVIVFATDRYGWSSILLAVELGILWFIFPEIKNALTGQGLEHFFLVILPTYLGIGIVVAAAKWLWFNIRVASKIKDYAANFKPSTETGAPNEFSQFLKFVNGRGYGLHNLLKQEYNGTNVETKEEMIVQLTPQAGQAVDRIAAWIWQWPVVCISFIFEDLVLEIGKWVSRVFGTLFGRFARMLIGRATANIGAVTTIQVDNRGYISLKTSAPLTPAHSTTK
jgi:hypothetical protein